MNARSVVGIAVVFAVAATGVVLCWKFASDGGGAVTRVKEHYLRCGNL